MEYFECDVPEGNGLCSDDACPCSEVVIPRGTGYLYIEQSLVNFRRKFPTMESARRAMQEKHEQLQAKFGDTVSGFYRLGPILVCEEGAKLRNLDLKIAAADARHWWETGQVPLRATPALKLLSKIFKGQSIEEIKEAAKAEIPENRIVSFDIKCDAKDYWIKGEGKSPDEALERASERIPRDAFEKTEPEITREGSRGIVEVSAYSEDETRIDWASNAPENAGFEKLECILPPQKGFIGLGRKKGIWKVHWSLSYIARVSFKKPAEVTVYYNE
jgi:hypothetical protein